MMILPSPDSSIDLRAVTVRATAGSGGRRSSSSGLHLVCNNSRFVFLTPGRVPNLASRVPGLSLRRLSADIEVVHGCLAFLAEGSRAPAAR